MSLGEFARSNEEILGSNDMFEFAMSSNGFVRQGQDSWMFQERLIEVTSNRYWAQQVSFFGPGGDVSSGFFAPTVEPNPFGFEEALRQNEVIEAIRKYKKTPEIAHRVAFLLGGIIRHMDTNQFSQTEINNTVAYAASITRLGNSESVDAILSATAMYLIADNPLASLDEDHLFEGAVYHASEAISQDPIDIRSTRDLGLSQVARLQALLSGINSTQTTFPEVREQIDAIGFLPTVGAEFHLKPEDVSPALLKRVALLNMTQYQRGSFIQLSRNDRGVFEIRMNPSIYPVTLASWHYMRRLIPELKGAYFHMTINRPGRNKDFSWGKDKDKIVMQRLKALGLLAYASIFSDIPDQSEVDGELDFGTSYAGQTVRFSKGKYKYTGLWSGGESGFGQLSIYSGFGDNLPYLVQAISLTLLNPEITADSRLLLQRIKTLRQALELHPDTIQGVFSSIDKSINSNNRMLFIKKTAEDIIFKLAPDLFKEE